MELANGEPATVVLELAEGVSTSATGEKVFSAFSVITKSTLVSVAAPLTRTEIANLASQLRPIA